MRYKSEIRYHFIYNAESMRSVSHATTEGNTLQGYLSKLLEANPDKKYQIGEIVYRYSYSRRKFIFSYMRPARLNNKVKLMNRGVYVGNH